MNEDDRNAVRGEYHARLEAERLAPLWVFFHDWFSQVPRVRAEPHLWSYSKLRDLVLEAARVIDPEEAERRVLVLENPGLEGERLVTESLYAGLQLIMPGEVAPCHRHSPAALRFVIEGEGAYTSVEGEKAPMRPGDFIVTPSWTWHEHGHEGAGPAVWLDVLDVAVIHLFNATFSELRPAAPPREVPARDSLYRYGMNMRPVNFERRGASPVFSYPYARAREALARLEAHSESDACHGLKMEYIDPTTGGPAVPTLSTFLQCLPAGFRGEPYRTTSGTIFCVVEGTGTAEFRISADETKTFAFRPWDLIVAPSWMPYAFAAESEAVIFSASDEAMQKKLGIWREQRGPA